MVRKGNKEEVIIVMTGLCGTKLSPREKFIPRAEILAGGQLLDPPVANGNTMLCTEFNSRVPDNVHCISNPLPGSALSQKYGL